MLAFRIDYLMGKLYAGDFRDRAVCEWPPHPARFFSALASAGFEGGGGGSLEALVWLEKQGPPQIAAPAAGTAESYASYVPTNYDAGHERHPRPFPARALREPVAHFIWPDAVPSEEIRQKLDDLAGRVAYLGKSSSLVRVRLSEEPPPPDYAPFAGGESVFRVPSEGRLDELRRLFELGWWDPRAAQHGYTRIADAGKAIRSGTFGEMMVFARTEGSPLPSEAALTLTTAFRNALLAIAGRSGAVPELLHGHTSLPHAAFLALPFAGYPQADGRLLGCGLLLPRDCDPSARQAVLRAAGILKEIALTQELGRWAVEEVLDPDDAPRSLRTGTWTAGSPVWKSVTPVLLDRFPKKHSPVEAILRESCQRAGLPEPVAIAHGPYSDLAGVPAVPRFRLLRNADDRPRWGVHVTLTFPEPVRGPLVIGAGRFFGLGLLRPAGPYGTQS
jgi:CRISPR-associated protein Csb2